MTTADPAGPSVADEGAAGVYVHFPFCARICPYCDFAVTRGDADARRRLVEAVCRETERAAGSFTRPIDTIYFGGGTPSLLGKRELGRILATLGRELDLRTERQIFLEANPEDVDEERLEGWCQAGISTLSLGVQALDEEALRFLGRRHSVSVARRAIALALAAGFQTVSIDLIYARPGQTLDAWQAELDAAVALGVPHLSCYQLTFEPGTPLYRRRSRGQIEPPAADLEADLFVLTHEHLAAAGFDGYEVSNFARSPRHLSEHNRKYWLRRPYLGLGPAAHSFADERRWWNLRASRAYVRAIEAGSSPVDSEETLSPEQQALERLLLGLRCRDGVDLAVLQERTGVDLGQLNRERLAGWASAGWIELSGGRLVPTLDGMARAECLAADLLLSPAPVVSGRSA